MRKSIVAAAIFILLISGKVTAQPGSTAYSFLQIGTSLSGNGMGEIRGTLNNGSVLQANFNPGLLGVHSFDHAFSVEFFSRRSDWLPQFQLTGLTLNSFALSARVPTPDAPDDRTPLSIGVGWSSTYLNLGKFYTLSEQGPSVTGTFEAYERVDGVSAGIGVEYGGRFGFGLGIKNIISSLAPFGTVTDSSESKATNVAFDMGFFAEFPVIEERTFVPLQTGLARFYPDLTAAASYTYRNIGGSVHYRDVKLSDPLPREIVMGLSLSGGLTTEVRSIRLPLFSFLFAREVSDIAVVRTSANDWTYQYVIGDIDLVNHLLFGKTSSFGTVSKGASVTFVGMVSFLEGANTMRGREPFRSKGTIVHLDGVFPYLLILIPSLGENTVFSSLAEHLQLNYVQSTYYGDQAFPLHSTTFEGLTASWR